jgi:hypothetical protein
MATIEQVRTLVNDPAGASQIFDDPHYQTIIDIEDNVYRAGAAAARTLAAYYAAKVSIKAGPVAVENQQKFEHYDQLAKVYDQRAREGGGDGGGGGVGAGAGAPQLTGVSISEMDDLDEDEDRYGGAFYRGLTSYPPSASDDDAFYSEG